MGKIILAMFATVDGFVEDTAGGMVRPEWSDDLERFWSDPNIDADCTLLYGSNAFRQNAEIWPKAAADSSNGASFRAMAGRMNALPKVVMSASLDEPGWNAKISRGSLRDTVEGLKSGDRDVIAVGGVTLAANLLAEDLVDEYRLLILPTLLGGGHSLFKTAHDPIDLTLVTHRVMDTGAMLLTYKRRTAL